MSSNQGISQHTELIAAGVNWWIDFSNEEHNSSKTFSHKTLLELRERHITALKKRKVVISDEQRSVFIARLVEDIAQESGVGTCCLTSSAHPDGKLKNACIHAEIPLFVFPSKMTMSLNFKKQEILITPHGQSPIVIYPQTA